MMMTENIILEGINIISDEEVYRNYLCGDEKACDMLVEKYGDLLTLYINGYLKDIHESEDLMIEAFSRIFAKERKILGDGAFKAYLFKTARNLALRYKQKYPIPFLGIDELNFEPESSMFADSELIKNERDTQLFKAMKRLRPEYREALYLVYFENMSYSIAGTVMKKSEQQMTNLVHRAKQSLKNILDSEGFVYADK